MQSMDTINDLEEENQTLREELERHTKETKNKIEKSIALESSQSKTIERSNIFLRDLHTISQRE